MLPLQTLLLSGRLLVVSGSRAASILSGAGVASTLEKSSAAQVMAYFMLVIGWWAILVIADLGLGSIERW